MTEIQGQQMSIPPDDVRISAMYDEHGRATSVDVTLNLDEVTAADINSIVANLRELPRAAVVQPASYITTNGGGNQTLLFGNDDLSRSPAPVGP